MDLIWLIEDFFITIEMTIVSLSKTLYSVFLSTLLLHCRYGLDTHKLAWLEQASLKQDIEPQPILDDE